MFVTHAPDLVMRMCDRVVLLDHGRVLAEGRPQEVVRDFRLLMTRQDLAYGAEEGTREVEIVSAEVFGAGGETREWFEPGDELVIQLDLGAAAPVEDPVVSFAIHDEPEPVRVRHELRLAPGPVAGVRGQAPRAVRPEVASRWSTGGST